VGFVIDWSQVVRHLDKEALVPTNVRVIRANDFIRATADGKLEFENSKKVLMEVAQVTASLADYEILLDTRKAQGALSVIDLWYLAAELSNLGKAFSRKTAVLCPLEGFDRGEFFALCAQNRGFRVNAFTSYEDAMEWLLESRT
jgi:hypothetical protein